MLGPCPLILLAGERERPFQNRLVSGKQKRPVNEADHLMRIARRVLSIAISYSL